MVIDRNTKACQIYFIWWYSNFHCSSLFLRLLLFQYKTGENSSNNVTRKCIINANACGVHRRMRDSKTFRWMTPFFVFILPFDFANAFYYWDRREKTLIWNKTIKCIYLSDTNRMQRYKFVLQIFIYLS